MAAGLRQDIMFSGLFTTLLTPFLGTEIDEDSFSELAQWQVSEGVAGLVTGAIAGEGPTLSPAERYRLACLAVEAAAGHVPVLAVTGTNSTAASIELTRAAKTAGASAAVLVTPYYNKPGQEGIYRHFEAVARAVDLPLIVNNCPARTNVEIAPATMERLARLPAIAGVVDEASDPDRLMADIATDARLARFAARECARLPFHSASTGAFSLAANVAPSFAREAWRRRTIGNHAAAARLDLLYRAFDMEAEPAAAKYAVSLLWPNFSPTPRLPLTTASEETGAMVRVALSRLAGALDPVPAAGEHLGMCRKAR
jgi:4-hydroxy-tetrahydrodipicolinate synthase